MQMKFQLLGSLLSNTCSLLYAAYVAMSLSLISILGTLQLGGWHSIELISYLCMVLILCAVQHYLSIRLKLDADLLKYISAQSSQKKRSQLTEDMDQALLYFKLMPENKSNRDWTNRFQGCIKLFKIQIGLLALQYLILIFLIFKLILGHATT